MNFRLASGFFVVFGLAVGVPVGRAQTWLGTNGSLWSTAANWSAGAVPANDGTASVIFSQSNTSAAVNLDTSWNVAGVAFNATPGRQAPTANAFVPTLGYNSPASSSLTLQGGGITNASPSQIALVPPLVAALPQTWDTGSGGLLVYGAVSGSGSVTKTGAGSLSLVSTQSSLAGGFKVTAGTVIAIGGSSLGVDGVPFALSNGATVRFGTNFSSTVGGGAFNHPLTLGPGGGTFTTRNGSNVFHGTISGPGALSFLIDSVTSPSASSYALDGDNTYAGGTTVGSGVSVIVTGTGMSLGTGNVALQSGAALVLGAASNLAPGRTVTLQGPTSSQYSSALVFSDAASDPAAFIDPASTGGVIALGGIIRTATLDFSAIGNGQFFLGAGGNGFYRAATLGAGRDGVYRFGGGTAGLLTLDGADNVLTGPRSVVVGETGVFQGSTLTSGSNGDTATGFARPNDYTGGTTLNGGTLVVGDDRALGSGGLTINAGSLQADGGARALPNAVTLNAALNKFRVVGANDLTFAGRVDLNGGARAIISWVRMTTFANVIGNGSLNLSGGAFVLAADNTMTGLTVSNATVRVTRDANLGAAGATLTISGGTLAAAGPALTLNRPIKVPYSLGAVDTNGNTVIFNGVVNAPYTLTKIGAGTLILANPGDTGSFAVNGGTLQVDNVTNDQPGNPVPVTVNSGGTLAGTGCLGYTSAAAGTISPGDDGPGTLTIISGLSLSNGTTLHFDLGTGAADKLVLSGGHYFEIQGSKPVVVNLSDAGGLAAGQSYRVVEWSGASTAGVTAAAFQLGASPVNATFTVTADDALVVTTSAYTPFQAWQSRYFGSINNASAAPDANPSGDGISNLLKYALGLDPTRAVAAGLPRAGMVPGYLTLTYTKPKSVTDIEYTPQFSDDLATWSSAGVTEEVLSDDGVVQTMRARVPSTGVNRRFLRLLAAIR